jgi:L-amino acid N-acyltransferase YncA
MQGVRGMKIRKAKLKDIKQIDKIHREGIIDEVKLQFSNKQNKDILKDLNNEEDRYLRIRKEINSKLNFWVVVENDNNIIAFGQAEIDKENKKKGMIQRIYVLREYRRKGIASNIMKDLISWLRKEKVESVSSGIFIKNTPSIGLSKKFGFKTTAVRMQKKLK